MEKTQVPKVGAQLQSLRKSREAMWMAQSYAQGTGGEAGERWVPGPHMGVAHIPGEAGSS